MKEIYSYSSPYTVGHKALARYEDRPGIFEVPVVIQEKVDGSQFSFKKVGDTIYFRSRNTMIYPEDAGMFQKGVDAILEVADKIYEGWIYRGEYLAKPKHNTLVYHRVPNRHVILFDIEIGLHTFLSPENLMTAADTLGLESVPIYYKGKVDELDKLRQYLTRESILGGIIEGIVVKPLDYSLFGQDKKVLMAKFVREDFKEKHDKAWKSANPGRKDLIMEIIEELRTPQRWQKAVQHLKEAGELEGSPRDIGKLMKEVPVDIYKDEADELKERIFKHFWKQISRGVTSGLPEWYKEKLATDGFDNPKEFVAHESVQAEEAGATPTK